MVFWFITLIVTLVAGAALYYASTARPVNAATGMDDATVSHFRLRLKELDADVAAGELPEVEAEAARSEIARELLRQQAEARGGGRRAVPGVEFALPASIALVVVLAFGTYWFLGQPQMPDSPLAARPEVVDKLNLDAAVQKVEAQLAMTPDDIRGWRVLAPVYMREQRFADAEKAYRRIIALSNPTPDDRTNLAEALMMQKDGDASGEAMQLLEAAAAADPAHVRSRFYIAGELMRQGKYADAVKTWNEVIALSKGGEGWLPTAQDGLAVAEARLAGKPDPAAPAQQTLPDADAIKGMVASLATRLEQQGGTIEEWTRLVRSRLVLGQTEAAQKAYDEAKKAYPSAADRAELDDLALGNGLK